MPVITITRQFGAGGSDVAQRVARALAWTVVDNEFIETVARRIGMAAETVAAHEERAPSLAERLTRALATGSPEVFVPAVADTDPAADEAAIVRETERVIAEAAQHGRVVLVGRGAQAVLASARPQDALHVYVIAPLDARIRTVAERLGVAPDDAAARIEDMEASRDRYVEHWYKRQRQDPANYHLVVNSGGLGYEGAARVVAAAASARGWS
jgi:cytidylate kinase